MSVTVEFAKTGAVPTQCLSCGLGSSDAANCIRFQEDQTCATGDESLGTTHCGTAAIKYVDYGTNVTRTGIFRGCFDCSGKFCLTILLIGNKWTLQNNGPDQPCSQFVLGDFGCDVTCSKLPLVTRIARTGLGTRLGPNYLGIESKLFPVFRCNRW